MKSLSRFFKRVFGGSVPHGMRLIAPLLLGASLIGILVSTMWFGGKRESLAGYAEANLLRFALSNSVKPAADPSKVVVISVKDTDLTTLRRAPHEIVRDAHIEEYASILERVATHNPRMIVVSWLGSAHPMNEGYLKPLTDTIDRLGIAQKTILAVHFYTTGAVPDAVTQKYQVAEARDCYYEVNSFCTWNPKWNWMPQRIADAFWTDQKNWTLSQNLPHTLPNFVLNLPNPATLTTFSFLDFRPPVTAEIADGAAVFIGNDVMQELHFRDNKDLLQKTFVAASPLRRSLMTDGLPFHVFWAAMAEMFIENSTVAVVPEWLCTVALLMMCFAILLAIRRLRGMALGPFLICAVSLPLMNVVGVKLAHVYMPVVPIIAAGFVLFTAAAFISVSMSNYRKWRLDAAESTAERTSDIKENFISLISHNLNTPIAQLRGLLDILIQKNSANAALTTSLIYLEIMRVTVRAVLNTSSMTTQPQSIASLTTRKIWQTFMDTEFSLLKRLSTVIDVQPLEEDEDLGEIWFYKFNIDIQTAMQTILYVAVFILVRHNSPRMTLMFTPIHAEPADPRGLVLRFSWQPSPSRAPQLFPTDFVANAILRYLETARQLQNIETRHETNAIVLKFFDRTRAN